MATARQPEHARQLLDGAIQSRGHAITFFTRDGGGSTTVHRAEAPRQPHIAGGQVDDARLEGTR